MLSNRLDQIAHDLPLADKTGRNALIEEAAELLTMDPDAVTDIPTPGVTDEQDERNSRPLPF
jgi:hypothetical protein